MRRSLIPTLLTLSLALAACSAEPASPRGESTPAPLPTDSAPALLPTNPAPAPVSTSDSSPVAGMATRVDEQGAVVIEITPLNIGEAAENLEFEVSMNTHSVDLGMNLATLATLTTDTGISVQASLWDAPAGGHHVSGRLIFPATQDGRSILEGATTLTLTIVNLDAPSRVFEWTLQ